MSLLFEAASSSSSSSSPRDCSKRGLSHQLRSRLISRKLLLLLSTPLLSLLFLLLLLWLILRPSAPEFSLRDAALLLPPPPPPSSPSADPLPAAATVTAVVAAKNPNAHVGAFYDRLRVRAACAGEPPAAEAAVPGFYQEPRTVSTVSAVVGPTAVRGPQRSAGLLIEIRLQGRLRWKVGMWVSRGYGFEVACLAVVEVGPAAGTSVPLSQCSTSM
ncbi:NDR1/HIN1-like protein 12 [Ananas comosus]|uniref:NDR1/HIN1-like protein 12 n=1 Tax=Ananas comosus TaxID=4615 RepID=A0A6P5FJV3_ANACO|nr:NDR1/HIN1-like protein 12 [Ananas comosus]